MELHLSLRKYNLPELYGSHSKERLKGNFSWQNHNILRQKHDEGESNGWNQLWLVNNFITWLVISKDVIYYLSDAVTQIPCYWVLSCWAAKKQKRQNETEEWEFEVNGLPCLYKILLYFKVISHALSGYNRWN